MSAELWQLPLCSTRVLIGSECCGVIQACLYQAEVLNNLGGYDVFILLWLDIQPGKSQIKDTTEPNLYTTLSPIEWWKGNRAIGDMLLRY